METALLTGLGLAAPAGFNAYLPLLILALADRFTQRVDLAAPYDALSSTPAIAVLVVLLTIEIVVDKLPGLDHLNDLVQTVIRPVAGAALVLASTTGIVDLNPGLAATLGLVAAGTVHAAKATSRPAITLGSGGILNPLVSVAEDSFAALASLVAIFLPVLVLLFLAAFAAFCVWAFRRARRAVHTARNASNALRR